MESYPVKVYIYDISKGLARAMSGPILGRQLDGIWHTAVVVYGQEIFYGGMGIDRCEPGDTVLGQPDRIEDMGHTEIPFEMFMDYLMELASSSYKGECYHLLDHNCNNFSDEVAQFLTGKSVPSYVTSLPQEVLNTPFGAMLRPFMDAMSVNPSGGTPISEFYRRDGTATSIEASRPSEPKHTGTASASRPNEPKHTGPSSAELTADQKLTNGVISAPDLNMLKGTLVTYDHTEQVECELNGVRGSLSELLGSDKMHIIEEMLEFVKATNPDWGVSRTHINLTERILKDSASNTGQQRAAAGLLQQLLMHSDIISMLSHDPTATYSCILQHYQQQDASVQERLAMGVCNCTGQDVGRDWLLGGDSSRPDSKTSSLFEAVCSICRHCLLSSDPKLQRVGAALTHNITASKVSEDLAVDLGCAVVELLQRKVDDETARHAITALCQCIRYNDEVAAIASVSGLTVAAVEEQHPKLVDVCRQHLEPSLAKYASGST